MFLFLLLGLGIGLILAGIILLGASCFYQKRMRSPILIRWAGVVAGMVGFLLVTITFFWK